MERGNLGFVLTLFGKASKVRLRGTMATMAYVRTTMARARFLLCLGWLGAWGSAHALWAQERPFFEPPGVIERLPPVEAEAWLLDSAIDPPVMPESVVDPTLPKSVKKPSGGGLGGPLGGNGAPLGARAYWIPSQNLTSQDGDLSLSGTQANAAMPLYMSEENGMWIGIASLERLEISTSAILPESRLPVPDELWKINVGTMHIRDLGDDWQAGGMFMVGAASDEPFAGLRDMNVVVMGFLNRPAANERDAWNFSLFYSPLSQLPFPIPGVAYVWRPHDQLTMNIGVPFSVKYQPNESLTLSGSYMPLTNVNLMATQELGQSWKLYGGYQVVNETFALADRAETDERFYVFDQRLTMGVKRELGLGFWLDFSAAYVFDRSMFQATSFAGDRRDELTIDPGVAGTIQLIWTR